MRLIPSLKRSLPRAGVFFLSSLTLSNLLNLPSVKADETNLRENLGISHQTNESSLPQREPTADIRVNKSFALSDQVSSKNNYLDTNQYKIRTKETYTPPSSVVIVERRSNCQTIIEEGHLIKGECNLTRSPSRRPFEGHPRISHSLLLKTQYLSRRVPPPVELASGEPTIEDKPPLLNTVPLNEAYPQLGLEIVPLEYSHATLAPTYTPEENRTSLIFPLPIPGVISSVFGWRIHPITGEAKMHTGTDLAAAEGTPVLAAYPGQVDTAGWTPGYGLMISLLHEGKTQESRYGHLSKIYVQPGEWVEQGTVIGRVGSTGISTGPHLHFEWRHLTAAGSIPVDAGTHLEYALNNLIYSLQRAQAKQNSQG